jgi:hypothetical protein
MGKTLSRSTDSIVPLRGGPIRAKLVVVSGPDEGL